MGIFEKPSEKFLNAIERNFHFSPPKKHGYDVVESIKAMHEGKRRCSLRWAEIFCRPRRIRVSRQKHYPNAQLTVHVSTKLNRSHLVHGEEALILPCLGRSDMDMRNGENQFVSCENSMGVVQLSRGVLRRFQTNIC
jgi:hypothetical protein